MTRFAQGFASPLADGSRSSSRTSRCSVAATRPRSTRSGCSTGISSRGDSTLDAITPVVIEAFLAVRPRSRPRSYNHLLGVLRRLFQWLVARGHVAHSPVLCPTRRADRAAPFILAPESARPAARPGRGPARRTRCGAARAHLPRHLRAPVRPRPARGGGLPPPCGRCRSVGVSSSSSVTRSSARIASCPSGRASARCSSAIWPCVTHGTGTSRPTHRSSPAVRAAARSPSDRARLPRAAS